MIKIIVLILVLFLYLNRILLSETAAHVDAKRLYNDLISGYNRLVRPVSKNTDRLTVKMGLKLTQILDVDEKNQIMTTNVWLRQEWVDYKLRWDPLRYGGIDVFYLPSNSIWIPDIVLYNNADGHYEVTLMTKATIYPDGKVIWEPPVIYKSSCTINVEFFPFDEQHCPMKFGSWTYDGFQVDLVHINQQLDENGTEISNYIPIGIDLRDYYQSVEWDIMAVPAKRNERHYVCCPEPYPDITFNITIRRKTLFYTVNLIIPCVGISFLTVLTFYLPSDSGEKIALCVNILLSLTVFFLLLSDLIPPTSLVVPLIGKYLLFTMMLVTLSILVTIIVLNVHFRSSITHTMHPWVRRLFLKILPKMLLMRKPRFEIASEFWKECQTDVNNLKYFIGEKYKYNIRINKYAEIFELNNEYKNNDFNLDENKNSKFNTIHNFKNICNQRNIKLDRKNKKLESKYPNEIKTAIKSVVSLCENMKNDNEEKLSREEWKFVALVLDRLFLWIFTSACIFGTIGIIFQAPSIYDTNPPIDTLISKRINKK